MNEKTMSFQNIIDAQGFELALAGMTIVFVALALVSLFIALLPRIMPTLNRILPEAVLHTAPRARPDSAAPADSDATTRAAAITYALHKKGKR